MNRTARSVAAPLCVALLTLLAHAAVHAQAPSGPPPAGGPPPGAQGAVVIDSVSYAGNKLFSAAQLGKESKLKAGSLLSPDLIKLEIERIVAMYRGTGRDLSISPDIQHPASGHVTVTLRIDENGKGGDAGAFQPPGRGPAPGAAPPSPSAPPAMPDTSSAAPGALSNAGPPPLNKPTAQTNFIAAIQVQDDVYLADRSISTAVTGNNVSNRSASGIKIASRADKFNGVYISGRKSHFTLSDSNIDLSGKGASDFDGVAAGVLVSQGGTLELRDVRITTNGVVSTPATATEGSTLKVYNSTLIANGGPVPSGYVRRIGPGMMEPPTPLGISGTARASLTMDHAKSYYYDSTIISEGWGALSTDATGGYVYLEANNCDIRTTKSGYGTYADGGAEVVINKSRMDTATYVGVIAGPGKITLKDVDARSAGNGVMIHTVMAPTADEIGVVQINGGKLVTRNAAILVKSANADITIDRATLLPENGDLILAVINDDPNATRLNGRKAPGTTAAIRNSTLAGNILRLDTERPMTVALTNTTLQGIIKDAVISLDDRSKWTASADSSVTLTGAIDVASIDAPKGVTISAIAGQGNRLKGSYKLAGGGVLNVAAG